MDRRDFLKKGLASLAALLLPWRAKAEEAPKPPAVAADAALFHDEHGEHYGEHYAIEQCIVHGNGLQPLSAQLVGFSPETYRDRPPCAPPTYRTQGHIARLLGPAATMHEFYDRYGDVMNAQDNFLVFELPRTDGSALFMRLDCVVLTTTGLAVAANDLVITETVSFMGTKLAECKDAAGTLLET